MKERKKGSGGFREGAGRPMEGESLRVMRGLKFNDQEWKDIQDNAAGQNMSAREYLTSLVEKDRGVKKSDPWDEMAEKAEEAIKTRKPVYFGSYNRPAGDCLLYNLYLSASIPGEEK